MQEYAKLSLGADMSIILRRFLAFLGLAVLAACAAPSGNSQLGTQWGEGVESQVRGADVRRASAMPLTVSTLHYSADAGRGASVRELQLADGRAGLRVLRENGQPWPIWQAGPAHLQGRMGQRYILEYRNYSSVQSYEIVATVDGLDVLNGRAGSLRNRGYVLRPGEVLRIEGFRKDRSEVAAFRFSAPADAYAANSRAGSRSNIGVIGTAVFELVTPAPRPNGPRAFPGDRGQTGFAPPPTYQQ